MEGPEALRNDTTGALPYSSLSLDYGMIRLLYLQPGRDGDDIRIQLKPMALEFPLFYEALSYVWGTELAPLPVLVNDTHCLAITKNLDCALRHLRQPRLARVLWIDALCIDQQNLQERNQQVQMMAHIYLQSYRTIIWLGPDYGYNYHNILLHMDKYIRPQSNASFVQLAQEMCRLGSSPWFSRVWVIQELVMSKRDPVVYIGRFRIPWSAFISGVEYLNNLFWAHPSSGFNIDDKDLIKDFILQYAKIASFQRLKDSARQESLETRLFNTMFQKATDPRDNIYGLLAISKFPMDSIKPDYTLPIQKVFAQTTAVLLQHFSPSLYCLYPLRYTLEGESSRLRKTPNLPSWVPDLALRSTWPTDTLEEEDYWIPVRLLRFPKSTRIMNLFEELPKPARIARFSQDYKTLFAVGTTLGIITWTSIQDSFCGPGAAHRLHDLYHTSVKQRGFTPASFYQAVYDKDPSDRKPSDMQDFEEFLMRETVLTDDTVPNYEKVLKSVLDSASNRTCFVTDSGQLGQSYMSERNGIRAGDILVGLFGINFPFILRPLEDDKYKMLNVAYFVDHQWGEIPKSTASLRGGKRRRQKAYGLREYEIV